MSALRIVDLTHPIGHGTVAYPGDPGMTTSQVHAHQDHGYQVTEVTTGSHVGTHIDAPLHVIPNGTSVADLPLVNLIGTATVVDVGPLEPFETIDENRVRPYLAPGARLLLRSGWSRTFGTPKYHDAFPQISPELASEIADAGVLLIGLEQPSVHHTHGLDIHRILLGAGCLIVEGLVLTPLQQGEVDLCCLPLPLMGVDGSPVRAIAIEKTP